jgi:hypothetical protein
MPRETSQAERCVRPPASARADERAPVVALHGKRHAVPAEQAFQHAADVDGVPARHERHREHLPAECVPHRERLADLAVPRAPPALVVERPQIVRCRHLDARASVDGPDPHREPLAPHLAEAAQHPRNGRRTRRARPEPLDEDASDLLGAVARVLVPELDDADDDLLGRGERARRGPPALLDEAGVAIGTVAPEPLVSRLPGDPELGAKRGNVRAALRRLLHELQLLAHGSLNFPGHAAVEQPRLSAMS